MEEEMLQTAIEAAIVAGEILLEHFRKIKKEQIIAKRQNDFVTFVDKEAEKKIIEMIWNRFPQHQILGEELGEGGGEGKFCWIVDPLDGTTNYIHGFPMFSVSIAVKKEGHTIVGVVYDPLRGDTFSAQKGKGAYLNGNKIKVSSTKNFADAFLATGFPFREKGLLKIYLECFEEIFRKGGGMRRVGSAALDLCYTACGCFDGFWELRLNPWDIAAGEIILKEAGGIVSDLHGKDKYSLSGNIIGANPYIHKELVETIERVASKYGL